MNLVVIVIVVLVVLVSTPAVEGALVDGRPLGIFLDHLGMIFDYPL